MSDLRISEIPFSPRNSLAVKGCIVLYLKFSSFKFFEEAKSILSEGFFKIIFRIFKESFGIL
jgi:hypothetical protein